MEKHKSSFHGEIQEIPNIYVDNFNNKDKMAYFLSHAHTDHTVGMFSRPYGELLYENGAKIYMSEETKIILSETNYSYNSTKQYEIVEPLVPGMTYTIDLPDDQSFQVTMIPVTHMIGAVMFLFKTNEKTVLYTGDFILEEDEINEFKKLHDKNGKPLKIDTMYVDATFDNDDYEHFPSRSLCHRELVNEIENWHEKTDRRVALFQNYKYAYDVIYKEIHRELKTRLFTNDMDMLKTYKALYGDANFLTGDRRSKIHICKNKDPQEPHNIMCGVAIDNDLKYLHIYMSAQRGCCYDAERGSAIHKESDQSLYLCYPTHCSKSQLDFFINYFSPTRTVKFPSTPLSTPSRHANTPFRKERERRITEEREKAKKRLF